MEEEVDAVKESVEKCVGSPSVTGSGQHDEDDIGKENAQNKEADSKETLKDRLKRLDAETNTINSGNAPTSFCLKLLTMHTTEIL